MRNTRVPYALGLLALAPAIAVAQDPTLTITPTPPVQLGTPVTMTVNGTPGDLAFVIVGTDREDFATSFGLLEVNPFTSDLYGLGKLPANGTLAYSCGTTVCDFSFAQHVYYSQAVTFQSPRVARGISKLAIGDFVTGDRCPPCVTEAPVDTNIWTCSTYLTGFYIPGCPSSRFDWVSPGSFAEYTDGTGRLTGTVKQIDDPSNRFAVDLVFSGRQSLATNNGVFPPAGSPKLDCMRPNALVEFGGPIDISEWYYYSDIKGTFTGEDNFAGTNFDVTLDGAPAQVGWGGSLKNSDWGLSAWLLFTRTAGTSCAASMKGDINVNMEPRCP